MNLEEIIKKYNSGELNRNIDEHGSGGFWDYAWDEIGAKEYWLKEQIYNDLLEVYERTKKLSKQDVIKLCEGMPISFPEIENDYYDAGAKRFRNDFIKKCVENI